MRWPAALFAASLLALAAGTLAARLIRLDARPMHGDEANQAVRAGILWETGVYEYDPEEHHGPSLYWLTLPALALSDASSFAETDEFDFRIVPVAFSVGLVLLLFLVSDGLGRGGALGAAVLTAVSPAMFFYSRYYVQEMLLVFFTFGAIACGWRYVRSRRIGWALATGVCFGLMHATKETWIFAGAAMAGSLGLLVGWTWLRGKGSLRELLGPYLRPWAVAAMVVAAMVVAAAFYSSFGENPRGPVDSILAYGGYAKKGTEAGIHSHPWHQYLQWLFAFRPQRGFFWSEALIGVLALLALISPRPLAGEGLGVRVPSATQNASTDSQADAVGPNGLVRFLSLYTILLIAIYSIIPYKTPWCLLSLLHALILLAGYGGWALLRRLPVWPLKGVAALLLVAGLVHLGWQTWWLNFRLPADTRNPWVYAHSSGDVLKLAAKLEQLAAASPEGHAATVHVVSPENYWPLPWYLRRFERVGYWTDAQDWAVAAAQSPPPSILILSPESQETIDASLPTAYNQQMIYGLRPSVLVYVYVREELWERSLRE